jgi:hypothetical protein
MVNLATIFQRPIKQKDTDKEEAAAKVAANISRRKIQSELSDFKNKNSSSSNKNSSSSNKNSSSSNKNSLSSNKSKKSIGRLSTIKNSDKFAKK